MKPALLIIDMQQAFFNISPVMTQSLEQAVRTINAAIELFREMEYPIVFIQHLHPENKLKPGEPGFEVSDQLAALPSDEHIHKTYKNSFNKTPLLEKLRAEGVDTVVVTGFCAEHCVLSTYRGAEDLDLKPILLRGALASDILPNIQFVESVNDIMSVGALRQTLSAYSRIPS